jgi:hypothetical protein
MCHAVKCRLTFVFPVEAPADPSACDRQQWAGEKWAESGGGWKNERASVAAAACHAMNVWMCVRRRSTLKQVAITGLKWRAALQKQCALPAYNGALVIVLLFLSSTRVAQYSLNYICCCCAFARSLRQESACVNEDEECTTSSALEIRAYSISVSCFPGIRQKKNVKSSETLENFNWKTDLTLILMMQINFAIACLEILSNTFKKTVVHTYCSQKWHHYFIMHSWK